METRVAIISIIVEDGGKIEEINRLLHETNEYIIGRMGTFSYTHLQNCFKCSDLEDIINGWELFDPKKQC